MTQRIQELSSEKFTQIMKDIALIAGSYAIAYLIAGQFTSLADPKSYAWVMLAFIPVWILCMESTNLYEKLLFYPYDRILRITTVSTFISMLTLAAMVFFVKDEVFSRVLLVTFVGVSGVLLSGTAVAYKFIATKNKAVFNRSSRVIIVGIPGIARKFEKHVQQHDLNVNILGYVRVLNDIPLKGKTELGRIEDLAEIIKQNAVDEVIFALPKIYFGEVEKYILLCEEMGLTTRMLLDMYDLKIAKTYLTNVGTMPMLTFDTVSLNRWQLFLKRVIDIVGASVGLMIAGFASLFVATAIKLDSPGPVVFAQNRVGLNGRIFKLYKFRSMCTDAEFLKKELEKKNEFGGDGLMFKMKDDPRITKVGKFIRKTSLDELPQFLNVLKGDMSLVGTRPPTVQEVDKYKHYHRRRISIKPGLTGMWQVSGRSEIQDFDEVVKLDTKYIDEWSIWLDLKIILKTFMVVFAKRGAC